MDILMWTTFGFVVVGFFLLLITSKMMDIQILFLDKRLQRKRNSAQAKCGMWWMWGAVAWLIMSMSLVVLSFVNFLG